MRRTILRALSIICTLSLLLTFVACGTKVEEYSVWEEGDPIYETIETDDSNNNQGDTQTSSNNDDSSVLNNSSKTEASNNSSKTEASNNSSKTEASNNSSKTEASNNSLKTSSSNKDASAWNKFLETMPESLRGTTITVASWNAVTDVPQAESVIKKFTSATGIKVKWEQLNFDTYSTEVAALVAGKKSPDIIRLKNPDLGLLDLCQPLSASGYSFDDYSVWDKDIASIYTVNGNVYAANMENTLIQQPVCLLYNKNLITKYDLEDPYTLWKNGNWTYNKFIEICTTFKDEAGSGFTPWTSLDWAQCANMLGSTLVKRNGANYVSNMNDPNLLKGFQMFAGLVSDGITATTRFDRNGFEGGKVLFFTESPIGARRTHYYFKGLKEQGTLFAVPFPAMDGQKAYYQYYAEAEAYAIPKGAKNAEAVPYFLRYYLDSTNYDENTFFSDITILDVYKSCMSATMIANYDYVAVSGETGISAIGLYGKLANQPKAQISKMLNEYAPQVENAVKAANDKLATIGK